MSEGPSILNPDANSPEFLAGFEVMVLKLGETVKECLLDTDPSREKVYQLLNALAVHCATIIVGTDKEALEFFMDSLEANMRSIMESYPRASSHHQRGPEETNSQN